MKEQKSFKKTGDRQAIEYEIEQSLRDFETFTEVLPLQNNLDEDTAIDFFKTINEDKLLFQIIVSRIANKQIVSFQDLSDYIVEEVMSSSIQALMTRQILENIAISEGDKDQKYGIKEYF